MKQRSEIKSARRWVVKIGSALLTNDGSGLDTEAIGRWAAQIAALRQHGVEVVLVSSGAVAAGMSRLGWTERPTALNELQAAAAVGQMGLVQAWETGFQSHGMPTAQVLLTHEDLADRQRYLNARSTLCTLLRIGAVPIVNENDTVAFEELRFGDNDNLAALVANLVVADVLTILTDQDGLFDRDPRSHADASLVSETTAGNPDLVGMAGLGRGTLGRGGMATKVQAARRAARSGTSTLIASGREPDVMLRLREGEQLGTLLHAAEEPMAARKRWMAGQLQLRGRLVLDEGAVRVLRQQGRSLLPVGVKAVEGRFGRGELLACVAESGEEVARGLVNYDSVEIRKIMGEPSSRIEALLGYVDEPELIHRDNLVLS
ncbi:MAG: glutamate 5-kinase [Gammaproteobacteria bacterium]